MDARSFGNFLVSEFTQVAKSVETNLLDMNYQDFTQAHRSAAQRNIVMQIVEAMPHYLDKFYQQGGNSAPQSSNTVITTPEGQ